MKLGFCLNLVLVVVAVGGCAEIGVRSNHETISATSAVDTAAAKQHYEEALRRLCDCESCEAEQLLNQSIMADDTYGPAHNALGKVYFDCGKHYMAAREFDRAAELMPGRGEPLNNLGLVYESVGQFDQAIEYFDLAANTNQESAEYLGNLIRARIRRGDRTSDLRDLLERLVLLDERQSWVDWARQELALNRIERPFTEVFSNSDSPVMLQESVQDSETPSRTYWHDATDEPSVLIENLPFEGN